MFYNDLDKESPKFIQIVIDGIEYDMHLKAGMIAYNGNYEFLTTLTEGEHTYYFTASDGTDTIRSDDFKTPNINKSQIKEEKKEGENNIILVAVMVMVIIMMIRAQERI